MITWLADVLRTSGVGVVEAPGWKTRGRPASTGGFDPRAVMWHHDGSADGASPGTPDYIIQGRPAVGEPGPLAQCWVSAPDGVWHVLAAGRCNHGGDGDQWGVIPKDQANTYAIGIETDHTVGEAWPVAQLLSLRLGTAAILTKLNAKPSNALVGHKEYAPTRKVDPAGLDMDAERQAVAAMMTGADVTPADFWNYLITSAVDGKKYSAARLTQIIHKRTYDTSLAVGALQAQVDLLATHTGLSVDAVEAAAQAGVAKAIAAIAADLADG